MRRPREQGFTLIEVAAALGVFAVVMLGLTLVFDRALESTSQVRFDEVGKTLAQQKLEEVRSLPYFIPQTENTGDVDVLDLYFPNTTGASPIPGATGAYDGTENVWKFTTTQTVTADGRAYTQRVEVWFVAPQSDDTLAPKAPVSGYDSDVGDVDQPTTNTLRAIVTVSRDIGGQTREVELDTVLVRREATGPVAEASASIQGAGVTGVTFQDGDGAGAIAAEVLASVADVQLAFREVAGSTSQASADPLDLIERDSTTSTPLQSEKPAPPSDGTASASVPNSSTGDVQVAPSASLPTGIMSSVNGTGAIGAWGSSSPSGTAEARVSTLHSLNPEGRATVASNLVEVNARDGGEAVPLRMLRLGNVTGSAEQRSTTTQASVQGAIDLRTIQGDDDEEDLPAVVVFASRGFRSNPNYRGVVVIDSIHVDAQATATTTSASAVVNWRVDGLRIWNPNKAKLGDLQNPFGDYGPSYTFGYISSTNCGWVGDPANCSPGTPNPVVIPTAYVGPTGRSLEISAGITVRDSQADPAAGFATASAAQKNVLFITTRDDVTGASPLEPMLLGLGNANLSVSYISHDH
jgi:prepilin-type N-terminal cleavage/methylation domain-containing protein